MEVVATNNFIRQTKKLDKAERELLWSKVENIIGGKIQGKPMRYNRKGTMEVYMGSKRLYFKIEEEKLILLEYSHKDEQ